MVVLSTLLKVSAGFSGGIWVSQWSSNNARNISALGNFPPPAPPSALIAVVAGTAVAVVFTGVVGVGCGLVALWGGGG